MSITCRQKVFNLKIAHRSLFLDITYVLECQQSSMHIPRNGFRITYKTINIINASYQQVNHKQVAIQADYHCRQLKIHSLLGNPIHVFITIQQ